MPGSVDTSTMDKIHVYELKMGDEFIYGESLRGGELYKITGNHWRDDHNKWSIVAIHENWNGWMPKNDERFVWVEHSDTDIIAGM